MKEWKLQDAKARFSECVDKCLSEGPQLITRRGTPTAVLVPVAEWEHLQKSRKPTLKELLLTDWARFDFDIPDRGTFRFGRKPVTFED
jgi:antitoxin Phd